MNGRRALLFIARKSGRAAVLAAILSVVFTTVAAAGSERGPPLDPDQAFRLQVSRTSADSLRVRWTIAPGYYLYRDMIRISAGGTSDPLPADIGDGVEKDDPTFGPTRIFLDHAEATVAGRAVGSTPGAALAITYQGCQDGGICYAPVTRTLDLATLRLAAGEKRLPQAAQSNWQVLPGAGEGGAGGIVPAAEEGGGMVNALLAKGGVALVLASYLVFGMALAFTPCVFPMYPILAGVLARSDGGLPARRGFVLSCVYVLAMASAFGLLGIAAAWSGQNLQMALQAPVAILAVALIFVALALSMFGFYQLRLPSRWVTAFGGGGRSGGSLRSAALLGGTSALIVGPCVTAPLAGALLYIAQKGDGVLGAAALFALGVGKGIPLIVFGTVGAKALPKAGPWMETVSKGFGLVFLAAAIWMVSPLVPGSHALALWALLLIGASVYLGAFDTLAADSPAPRRAGKAAGLAAFVYGTILAVGAAGGANDPLRPLVPALQAMPPAADAQADFASVVTEEQLAEAVGAAGGRPSLVYFTADWCVTCASIERNVLSDDGVKSRLAGFNRVKVDVSDNSPGQRQLMQALRVAGPPTMIFVDAGAREISDARLVGDVSVEALLASAGKASARP